MEFKAKNGDEMRCGILSGHPRSVFFQIIQGNGHTNAVLNPPEVARLHAYLGEVLASEGK